MDAVGIPAQRDGRHRRHNPVTAPVMGRALVERSLATGFTLVEMLLVVSVVAMLAIIAYPSYVGYKVRANRAAAQSFLIDLANREQLHLLDARGYASTLADLGVDTVAPEVSAYYVIPDPVADNTATPPVFTVSAMAKSGTMQARDGDLSINSSGVKSGHW
jgi:type IV pilus assembly protein PilE